MNSWRNWASSARGSSKAAPVQRIIAFLLGAFLAACTPAADPADPALWEVAGPDGQRAWLFGTVHALERPAEWKTPAVAAALDNADTVLVEIADAGAEATTAFEKLAASPGHPALSARVRPELRANLARFLKNNGMRDDQFGQIESWAAALMLAQAATADNNPRYGIDRAVIRAAGDKPVMELEGAAGQLRIFDSLPESEQRDLLEAIVTDASALSGNGQDLAAAWRRGDMAAIARETEQGLLADPELREALFTGRNLAWRDRIAAAMAKGRKPFVAVGAAHMAGPEGLPALLAEKGFTVTRIR